LIDPEDDCYSNCDCGDEGVGATVIADVNTSPVFEFPEHIFDFLAAFVERLVECNLHFSVGLWRDAWGNVAFKQRVAEPVGVISLVAEQVFSVRNGVKHEDSALKFAHLAFGKQQNQRTTRSIAYSMKLGVQTALFASNTSVYSPFSRKMIHRIIFILSTLKGSLPCGGL
jgi:hypothetical protein